MNFTGWGDPCQKCLRGRLSYLVKFTFRTDPHQKAFWGTLLFEVNSTGWGYPCQKCLRGWLGDLVKFTFRTDPHQKAFRGIYPSEVERLCVHLRALPPLQCLQRHIAVRGEFHGLGLPPLDVHQRPIRQTREIHLRGRPLPERPQRQVEWPWLPSVRFREASPDTFDETLPEFLLYFV